MDRAVFLEGAPRFAITIETHIDKKTGEPIYEDCGAHLSIVQNDWQGTYRKAEIHYELQRDDLTPERRAQLEAVQAQLSPEIEQQLDIAKRLSQVLDQDAIERGELNINDGGEYSSEKVTRRHSILANHVLGYLLHQAGAPAVNRINAQGDKRALDRFLAFTEAVGVPWKASQETIAQYLSELDERAPDKGALRERIGTEAIKTNKKAEYSHTESGHSSLALPWYAHGSASNRLVSGMLNLANAVAATRKLRGEDPTLPFAESGRPFPFSEKDAEALAIAQTELQNRIDNVEQEVGNIRDAVALQDREGQVLDATIHDVSTAGVTFITDDPEARVFVPMTVLKEATGERYEMESPIVMTLGKHRFEMGERMRVKIERVVAADHLVEAVPEL